MITLQKNDFFQVQNKSKFFGCWIRSHLPHSFITSQFWKIRD